MSYICLVHGRKTKHERITLDIAFHKVHVPIEKTQYAVTDSDPANHIIHR